MKLFKYGLLVYALWRIHKAYHEGTLKIPELPRL
jgi:hypothetical protein